LNRLKDEFLATLSHEMRTPLAAVLGWSRMLASGQLDPERAAQAIDAIQRNAQAQSKIVEDILDVARGMSGNLSLEVATIDLVTVAQRSVEAVAPAAAGKNIQLDVRAPAAVPAEGDASRLQQVMWNLLSNAVKFTPAGGRVTVDVAADDGSAEFRVSDSGVDSRELPALCVRQVPAGRRIIHAAARRAGTGAGDRASRHRGARRLDRSAQRGRGLRCHVRRQAPAPRRTNRRQRVPPDTRSQSPKTARRASRR
jgi:K+-sensing histidine kinase KdpD